MATNGSEDESAPTVTQQKRATVALNAAGIASLADRFSNFEQRFTSLEELLTNRLATPSTPAATPAAQADHVEEATGAGHKSAHGPVPTQGGSRGHRHHPYNNGRHTLQTPATGPVMTAFSSFAASAPPKVQQDTYLLDPEPEIDDQVRAILETTANRLATKGKKKGFPHSYVFRGEKKDRTSLGELTLSEHCWGLIRVIEDATLPPEDKPFLVSHLDAVLEDAREFPWENVRRWSEEVFSLISESRLKGGWSNETKIELLRMSISRKYTQEGKPSTTNPSNQSSTRSGATTTRAAPQQQDHLKGGPPCKDYNNNNCSLQSGHLVDGVKRPHICSYCLTNLSLVHQHSEKDCRIKQKKTSDQKPRQTQGFRE